MKIRVFFCLLLCCVTSQIWPHPLDSLNNELHNQHKEAFSEIIKYIGSEKEVTVHLGYHKHEISEHDMALGIIRSKLIMTPEETIDFELNPIRFINKSYNKIHYDETTASFIITPLSKHPIEFELLHLSSSKYADIKSRRSSILNSQPAKEANVDLSGNKPDSRQLIQIASEAYRNASYHDIQDYTDLLGLLTNLIVGELDEQGRLGIDYVIGKGAANKKQLLNQLIFYIQYSDQFEYDMQDSVFKSKLGPIRPYPRERELFENLTGQFDSNRVESFIELTKYDPLLLDNISKDYRGLSYGFDTKMIPQIARLVVYLNVEGCDVFDFPEIREQVKYLNGDIEYKDRYALENELIETLDSKSISAFEYWALIYDYGASPNSVGRVVDKYYSQHWQALIHDDKQLAQYLKKSHLFSQLGISGFCSVYLSKFFGSDSATIAHLEELRSDDQDIEEQKTKAIRIAQKPIPLKPIEKKFWAGNRDFPIPDLKSDIPEILAQRLTLEEKVDTLTTILARIRYHQIDEACKLIDTVQFKYEYNKYSFLDRDFGFFGIDFSDSSQRESFLILYNTLTELQLYHYLLTDSKIEYMTDSELDFDKIYDILTYDIVMRFTGSGGTTREEHVYAVIKILELEFETTLGYPIKFCNSDGMWGCDSRDRARDWRKFLSEKDLVKPRNGESISFGLELTHYR